MDEPELHPLTEARKRAGLTQADLAERVGVHRVTIARLEGGAEPGVTLALQLADALFVPLGFLWEAPDDPRRSRRVDSFCPECGGTGRVRVS